MDDLTKPLRATGRCLCGGVRHEIIGPLRPVVECHCPTCRRFTGGLLNATAVRQGDISIHDEGSLKWYQSSPNVRRGFCGTCGSGLFYDREDMPHLGVMAGSLEEPTGLRLSARILMKYAADYSVLGEAVPAVADGSNDLNDPATWKPGRVAGACLCQSVRYEIEGPMRPVVECHCQTCRRFTGGLWNATTVHRKNVEIHDAGTLSWHRSSPHGQRGFCAACGSSLFMFHEEMPYLAITAGTLHEPTGLRLALRIFTADTGDYYVFGDEVPRHQDNNHGLVIPDA